MYIFQTVKANPLAVEKEVSTGAVKGLNKLVSAELQSMDTVQVLDNYFPLQNGRLQKSLGSTELDTDVTGSNPGTSLTKFTTNQYLYTHGTSLSFYNAGTVSDLKTDFTTSDPFESVKAGDFLLTSNGGDKIWLFIPGKAADTKFISFTGADDELLAVGEVITDTSSSATGTIQYVTYTSTTAGLIVLTSVLGTFDGGEITSSGSTTCSGSVLQGDNYEIPAAPMAKHLFQSEGRLYAGNTDTNEAEVRFSQQDTKIFTEIPYLKWGEPSEPPLATDGGTTVFGNAGKVNSINSLGSQIVVGYDDGKQGFRIVPIEVSGTGLAIKTTTDFQREDFGMERGSVNTVKGFFYVNESGLWQMISGGNTAQPFSESEANISRVLGEDFIDGLDFTDADLVFEPKTNRIFITCRQDDASFNNLLIWYDIENQSFGKRKNWQIARFMKDGSTLYGISSLETKIFKLFDGHEDDGEPIVSEYQQELPLAINALYTLNGVELKGFFGALTNFEIQFDVYDKFGVKQTDFVVASDGDDKLTVTPSTGDPVATGFNTNGFNNLGFGGYLPDGETETLAKKDVNIDEFTRIIVKYRSEDRVGHELTWSGFDIQTVSQNNTQTNLN